MSRRVDFNDLFEYNDNNVLTLKRKTIINGSQYEIGDEFTDDTFKFPFDNPYDYFYIINPLRVGDTLEGWMTLK
jgi:hypothetical protein